MSPQEIEQIFDAQCDNVRELKSAWTHVNKTINQALKEDNDKQLALQTRILGLIFCAYSEATFLKLIHTDKKFSSDEIEQIKASAKHSIVEGWKKCLELALRKVDAKKSNHVPNVQQRTLSLIKDHIEEPSLIRNKIAHGQWHTALNRKNTKINQELTDIIQNLTVIELTKYRAAFDSLSDIIEDIIESPNHAHWKFYWEHVAKFEQEQKKMSGHTLEAKRALLKKKAEYHRIYA
ncbi:hypothetical protein [Salinivibrio kushneri]|uniref:hypothetical protein n=1 Tax=Salinivibrio kushneri TaxID=1908198 RepID=UPI000984DDB3|nr:hypothetical protein [Salinivibrio kushneri]OOE61280.1 hypothetical protein BZG18_09440 [Salinivibrio kushneri]